jgi:hypothetical protein
VQGFLLSRPLSAQELEQRFLVARPELQSADRPAARVG